MPFRVGEALSGGGSVSMPPFRRLRFGGSFGAAGAADRPGICNL